SASAESAAQQATRQRGPSPDTTGRTARFARNRLNLAIDDSALCATNTRRCARRSGTTNKAVRDFRARGSQFVARTWSHMTTAARTEGQTGGKHATIPTRRERKKYFYINVL